MSSTYPLGHPKSQNITYLFIHVYHHDHHSTQTTIHAFSICTTALGKKQTTSASYCGLGPAPAPFRPPHVPMVEDKATRASYRGSKTTTPPLTCTMQQAHVSLHKGMPLIWGYGQKFNGMPLCKVGCNIV